MFLFHFQHRRVALTHCLEKQEVLLENDWFKSLENVGNESERLRRVSVWSRVTARAVGVVEKIQNKTKGQLSFRINRVMRRPV